MSGYTETHYQSPCTSSGVFSKQLLILLESSGRSCFHRPVKRAASGDAKPYRYKVLNDLHLNLTCSTGTGTRYPVPTGYYLPVSRGRNSLSPIGTCKRWSKLERKENKMEMSNFVHSEERGPDGDVQLCPLGGERTRIDTRWKTNVRCRLGVSVT